MNRVLPICMGNVESDWFDNVNAQIIKVIRDYK